MVLDSNTPIIKNEIIAGKKLGVGASLEMSSTDSAGVFNVGGDSIFSMKRGGYLGVGTLVPSTSIDINSMTGKNLGISMNDAIHKYRWSLRMREDAPDANTNPEGALIFASDIHAAPEGVMYMKRTGEIGVGTSKPAAKLHIQSKADDDAASSGLMVSNTKNQATLAATNDGASLTSSTTLVLGAEGGAANVYLTHDDSKAKRAALGVGVPSPSESLHVTGNARFEGGGILLGSGAFATRGVKATTIEQPGKGTLALRTDGKDRVVVAGDGTVSLSSDAAVDGTVTVKAIKLGDLTLTNSKGKLQVCADGQPSSCRNI
jgi:hypothetical protein